MSTKQTTVWIAVVCGLILITLGSAVLWGVGGLALAGGLSFIAFAMLWDS